MPWRNLRPIVKTCCGDFPPMLKHSPPIFGGLFYLPSLHSEQYRYIVTASPNNRSVVYERKDESP